jgi:hypothetical protein
MPLSIDWITDSRPARRVVPAGAHQMLSGVGMQKLVTVTRPHTATSTAPRASAAVG